MNHEAEASAAERIEKQALDSFFESLPETAGRSLGLDRTEIGGASVFIARKESSILLNRVIGLGIACPATRKDVNRIRDYFAEAGVIEYFLQVQPWIAPADTWNWLFDAGYGKNRGWTQFVRGTETVETRETSLRIKRIDRNHAMDFARIAAQGFDLSNAVMPALAAMVGKPGWYHFMSFDGEKPAGVAAMFVADGMAWFDWAATDPMHRGQGSQTALLARRIQVACELGAGGFSPRRVRRAPVIPSIHSENWCAPDSGPPIPGRITPPRHYPASLSIPGRLLFNDKTGNSNRKAPNHP